jgi:spore coat polysaccharide biosynthesis protein SpsF (cytidylyltransferase family)
MTEIVRTGTLRCVLNHGVSSEQQEHVTLCFDEHREDFRIVNLPSPSTGFVCPGFAVDSKLDLVNLDGICTANPATLDLTRAEADRIHAS